MIASVPFVQKTFDHFNAMCFNGVLPAVPIVLTKAGTFLGKMEYKSGRDIFGIISSHYDFRLKISTGFDLTQEELSEHLRESVPPPLKCDGHTIEPMD